MESTTYPVWMTLTIGGKKWVELLAELEARGFKVGNSIRKTMESAP